MKEEELAKTLLVVREESSTSRAINTTTYAIPVAACVGVVIAVLNRYYADMGIELISAIGILSGVVFNVLYDLLRFYRERLIARTTPISDK